jgi:hypothetical protein
MAVTRADFYTSYRRLVSALNGGTASSFTAVLDDPRRSPGELFASLQAADDEICTLIGETEGYGYRPLFLSETSDLNHGDTLPDRLGPITQVKVKYLSTDSDYKAGKFDKDISLADIERWRANTGTLYGANHSAANSSLSGFYLPLGDEIYFTGHRAKGKIATYTRTSREVVDGAMTATSKNLTSVTAAFVTPGDIGAGVLVDGAGVSGTPLVSRIDTYSISTVVVLRDAASTTVSGKSVVIAKLQTPQDLENGLLAIAMLNQIKRGDNPPFANLWAQAAESAVRRIKSGEKTIPSLELAQAA